MSDKPPASKTHIAGLQAKLDDRAKRLAEQARRIGELEKERAVLQAKVDNRGARLIAQVRRIEDLENQVLAYKIETGQFGASAQRPGGRAATFDELPDEARKPLILVLGSGRAGTTGLFYCVKSSAEAHFQIPFPSLFEPRAASNIAEFHHEFGVVKMILDRFLTTEQDFMSRFSKRIFIVRDPRDNLVSRLLWYVRTRLPEQSDAVYQETLSLFAQKERAPDSIGVLELFSEAERKFGGEGASLYAQRSSFLSCDFFARYPDEFFVVRYEDFVEGNLTRLSEHLGFELLKSFELAPVHQATMRTGGSGSWRNWFTDDDYARFVRPNIDRLTKLGYDDCLPYSQKKIEPAEATEYLKAARVAAEMNDSGE